MSVSRINEQATADDRVPGSVVDRAIGLVMGSWFASARGRFVMAAGCVTFLTYLLLSQDPWWLFRAFPKEAARTLKHGVIDKVYHFVAYFGTTCLLMWYAASGTRRTMYGLAAAVTAHAVITEFLQQFVPRRTTDIDDLLANLAGIAAGVGVGLLLRRVLTEGKSAVALLSDEGMDRTLPESPAVRLLQPVPGVSTRMLESPVVADVYSPAKSLAEGVPAARTSFERTPLSSEQIAEVQPRQIDYRVLGIVSGVLGLLLASTYAVHGWQVGRLTGDLLQNARQAVAAGEIEEALNFFEQYCNSAPNDVNALAEFAILSDDARVPPQGGRGVFLLFERVLRKDQTRDDVRRRAVVTALELGRYSDGLSHAKVLQQTFPKEGLFDYQAGLCHEYLSNHKSAAEAYQAAIDDTPELIEPWERLAWIKHAQLSQTEAAEQLMLRLVQVNSQNIDAWIARAEFRVRTDQSDEAGQDIERALALAPNNFAVLQAVGDVGIARARHAKTDGQLPKAKRIAIHTKTLLARDDLPVESQSQLDLYRVVLEAEFGNVKNAFDLADALLVGSTAQNHFEIHELMADIAIAHGHVEQARTSLGQLPRTEVTDGQRLRLEASVAMSEQRWGDATETLEAARRILAETPEQLAKVDLDLAVCLGMRGQVEDQLVAYRRVLKYAPQLVEARRGLASTLETAGRYPEALAEYRMLVHVPAVRLELVQHLIDYNETIPEVARGWKEVSDLLAVAKAEGDSSVEVSILSAKMLVAKHEFEEARLMLSQARREHGEDRNLIAHQIRVAELSGDVAEASRLKGKTLAAEGLNEDAERQLRLTLIESDRNGDAAISLMQLYLQNGRAGQAVDVFKRHARTMTSTELSRTYEVFGDLQRAVGILQEYIEQQPEDVVATQHLAELYVRGGRPDLAEPLFERLLSTEVNISEEEQRAARRSLAILLAKKRNYRAFQRATALMDKNAGESPDIGVNDLRTMTIVLQHSLKPEDHLVAIGLLERLDDRRRMNNEDRWRLGKLYIRVGFPEQAAPQFHQAVKDGLNSPVFLSDLITHQIRTGALAEAREQFERLPNGFPEAELVRLRCRYLVAVGQSSTAISELDDFVKAATDSEGRVGRLLLAVDVCRDALQNDVSADQAVLSQATDRYLRTATEEDPKQVSHLVRWLLERGRDVEAFSLLDLAWQQLPPESAARLSLDMLSAASNRSRREIVEQHLAARSHEEPASLVLKRHLADVWSLSGKHAEAEELYREILRVDSRNVAALNALSWNLAMRGRLLDEAMTYAERAIAEAGPVSQLLDTRGCVKLAQSRLRAATEDLISAAELDNSPTTLLHLAFVRSETGETELARQTLSHAIETGLRVEQLHPLDRDLYDRLNSQLKNGTGDKQPLSAI
jgi:tetratricopeptide (TPR) repeat protein/VanZ family protein